ncbi:MAG: hypothetical protein BGN88_06195 [Clostridiales bacterium 43-6]|nr:MAG: hypothetical protein BGN88_06195 [Clostridiales bacterium 43-6]
MRDFYDVYIILTMYDNIIDKELLNQAIHTVAVNGNTTDIINDSRMILMEISRSEELKKTMEWVSEKI